MPMLSSSGQHRALCVVPSKLRVEERLFAFLDDIYVVCSPEWVSEICKLWEEELWRHSRIQIHAGKTQIWNSGGHVPVAQVADPDARVWFGDHALPLTARARVCHSLGALVVCPGPVAIEGSIPPSFV